MLKFIFFSFLLLPSLNFASVYVTDFSKVNIVDKQFKIENQEFSLEDFDCETGFISEKLNGLELKEIIDIVSITDDSLQIIQKLFDSLNNRINEINSSLFKYYNFKGKKISFSENTFNAYHSFRKCQIYRIDLNYYEKHRNKNGSFQLGTMSVSIPSGGSIGDDFYFGINSENQSIVWMRVNWGTSLGSLDLINKINVDVYNHPNEDCIKKINKQISKVSSFHLLSEKEKNDWLLKTTNLDDEFFIFYQDSLLTAKELVEVNQKKLDYLLSQKNKKEQEDRDKLLAIEEARVAEANKYPGLVKIGSHFWQNQNCRITKYMNGDPIIFARNAQELENANKRKEGAYCFIDFNSKLDSNWIVYNWFAIMDPRGFGTSDLRLPNWSDWKNLINTFEKDGKTSNDLKKVTEWVQNKNFPSSNYYGFNGLPTCYAYPDGYYQRENFKKLNGMYFWIPDDNVGSYFKLEDGKSYQVSFVNDGFKVYYSQEFKDHMFPVRLVKGENNYFDGTVVEGKKQGHGFLYVRKDDNFRMDYINYTNVQAGSVIEGDWIENKLQGRATITWVDGTKEEALFVNNMHQGTFRVDQNKTQKCMYDGKTFNSHYKKTAEEIEEEKSSTKNVVIRAYRSELYCNSTCESNARAQTRVQQDELKNKAIQDEMKYLFVELSSYPYWKRVGKYENGTIYKELPSYPYWQEIGRIEGNIIYEKIPSYPNWKEVGKIEGNMIYEKLTSYPHWKEIGKMEDGFVFSKLTSYPYWKKVGKSANTGGCAILLFF